MKSELISRPLVRKGAAFAILVGLVYLVYAAAIGPLFDYAAERRASLAALQSALDRYAATGREVVDLENRLEGLKAERQVEDGYIEAANETLAAATVQSRIKDAVIDAGGKLHSIEILRPESDGVLQKVSVRARIAVELAGLQRVLHAVNETSPALFFETLDIARADDSPRLGTEREARLVVDFTVFGYLRRSG